MHDDERIVIENGEIYREEIVYQNGECFVKRELVMTKEILEQVLYMWGIIK